MIFHDPSDAPCRFCLTRQASEAVKALGKNMIDSSAVPWSHIADLRRLATWLCQVRARCHQLKDDNIESVNIRVTIRACEHVTVKCNWEGIVPTYQSALVQMEGLLCPDRLEPHWHLWHDADEVKECYDTLDEAPADLVSLLSYGLPVLEVASSTLQNFWVGDVDGWRYAAWRFAELYGGDDYIVTLEETEDPTTPLRRA